MNRCALALSLCLVAPLPATAQHALADGGTWNPSVPTPGSVLGYEIGDRFTPHHMLMRYLDALAATSPRIRLDTVAHTFEGREVVVAIVTSQANQARLDAIRSGLARIADPRGQPDTALDDLVATLPVVVWLGHSVHGNEASGVEAAIALLYQLAAGQDAQTRAILDSTVVLIDPVQNPDGHERHVQDVMRMRNLCEGCFDGGYDIPTLGGTMVHSSGWPGARTSHYLFDLNRDWFILSHPETRGRVDTFREWNPHVAVDLHEMGSGSTYFFAPPMEPVNRNVHGSIFKWWDIFAAANAAAFDRGGWSFFRREGYDEFYPGYGVSWPILVGGVGMTYEQASSSAGAIRRDDGTVLTLREAALHHYTAGFATALVSAQRRHERLADYLEFRRSAVTDARRHPVRQVVIARDAQGRADSLVSILLGNGIEVHALGAAARANATPFGGGRTSATQLAAGTYVVDLAQPNGRLARALLEPEAELDSAFIAEELESRRTGRGDRFYDVTAWSLPLTFRVSAWTTAQPVGPLERVTAPRRDAVTPPARASYGYAFEAGSEAAIRMLGALLQDSVRVWHAPRSFRAGGRDFPHGAFLVRVAANEEAGHELVAQHAAAIGTQVTAIASSMVETGTDLGSNSVYFVRTPRIALAGGQGVSAYSFGWSWFAFDQRLRYPAVNVSLGSLGGPLLDQFDVLVIPSTGNVEGTLGESGRQNVARWVRNGGTLVTLDGATSWLTAERTELSRFRLRRDTVRADSTAGAPLSSNVPGAIARTTADTLSWLLAGVNDTEIPVLVFSSRIYTPPSDIEAGEVVLWYAGEPALRMSGYMWPEVPARLAQTPYLWTESVGRGRVIAFAGDPNFRDMWRGLLPIFANAVLLGPSH